MSEPVSVTIRYVDGCPRWRTAVERVREALTAEGLPHVEPTLERIETAEEAERLRFVGSPSILIDGHDPFLADEGGDLGLSCRVFDTPGGLAGSPTTEQLRDALQSV